MQWMLRTERLIITPWTATDLEDACLLWGDEQVMALLGGPLSRAAAEERLTREVAAQQSHGLQYWRVHTGSTFAGCCGLKHTVDEGQTVVELGFHFLPSHWGRGYATEAAYAVVGYAFETLKAESLFAGHHPRNEGSRGVLTKLGFKLVGDRFYPPTGLQHPWYSLPNPASLGQPPSRTS
jgi:[ribosomal protein S5]-alanine N-acetyltransferase